MTLVPLRQEFAPRMLAGGPQSEEGRLRDALLRDGEFCDAIVMSVLSTDNI